MSNRFIFSLRFSSKVFMKLFKLSLALVFFMTLFRMNLFLLYVFNVLKDLNFGEIAQSFLAGLRFDLLVFGFIFVPIYPVVIVQAIFEKWPRGIYLFYKIYFSIAWLAICALTFVDFFYFARHGRRMRFAEYSGWNPEVLIEQAKSLEVNQVIVFTVISLVLLLLGYMVIKAVYFGEWKDEYSPHPARRGEIVQRILLPIIFIFLAARGTVTPHHLNIEHSDVSNSKELNEMALNAVWCFDK